jgi:DNA-binding NarL/FixJ family response regulator
MTDPVRVLIVDDQAPFRRAARAVVTATSGFEVVGEAESGEEAVELADALTPGLVLMDINLPGINGIEATRRITAAHPDAVVMLLSTYQAGDLPSDAGSSGAAQYVHKEEFGPAVVREVAAGGSVIDPKVVEALVDARSRRADSPLQYLTPRESEVLAEMAQGRNNASVAAALGLSERAVEKHINSVFSKLGLSEEPDVHRRVKAVLLYLADR